MRAVAAPALRRVARSPGWRIAFGAYVLGLYGLVGLAWFATKDSGGGIAYGLTVSLTLAAGLVYLPVLAGQTVAGDRENGTLDLVRTTQVRSLDHALGLVLLTAVAAAVLVACAVPLIVLAATSGGVDLPSTLLAPAVLWVSFTAVATVGLAASAVASRARYGVAAALIATGVIVLGCPLAYSVAVPATEVDRDRQVRVDAAAGSPTDEPCTTETRSIATPRTQLVWWLLAPDPVVVVADAAPAARSGSGSFDPLGAVSSAVRQARAGVGDDVVEECWAGASTSTRPDASSGPAVWPWGLGALVGIGALATAFTERRLRTPSRPPSGHRLRLPRRLRRSAV